MTPSKARALLLVLVLLFVPARVISSPIEEIPFPLATVAVLGEARFTADTEDLKVLHADPILRRYRSLLAGLLAQHRLEPLKALLQLGGLVSRGDHSLQWAVLRDEFFERLRRQGIATILLPGEHERRSRGTFLFSKDLELEELERTLGAAFPVYTYPGVSVALRHGFQELAGLVLIFLNSTLPVAEQVKYLDLMHERYPGRGKLVFTHQLPFPLAGNRYGHYFRAPPALSAWAPRLAAWNLLAVFSADRRVQARFRFSTLPTWFLAAGPLDGLPAAPLEAEVLRKQLRWYLRRTELGPPGLELDYKVAATGCGYVLRLFTDRVEVLPLLPEGGTPADPDRRGVLTLPMTVPRSDSGA